MNQEKKIYIGTSGWHYDHWKGVFYPDWLSRKGWLSFYCERFNAVEVNATFYRNFSDKVFLGWGDRVPAGFRFVFKAPRLISHRRRLRGVEREAAEFFRSASLLGSRFGAILLQLAPDAKYDPGLLEGALRAFGSPQRIAVEFRNRCWLTGEVRELLKNTGAVFCNVDSPDTRPQGWATAETAYYRLHGRREWYSDGYHESELEDLACQMKRLLSEGVKTLYVFFNNDYRGFAPKNAVSLKKMLRADGGSD